MPFLGCESIDKRSLSLCVSESRQTSNVKRIGSKERYAYFKGVRCFVPYRSSTYVDDNLIKSGGTSKESEAVLLAAVANKCMHG